VPDEAQDAARKALQIVIAIVQVPGRFPVSTGFVKSDMAILLC
jgi:hypothetical protein